MSGPQGSDPASNPAQPWPGQQPESGTDQPSSDASGSQWQPPASGSEPQPSPETPSGSHWQPPAYTPQQYPQPGQSAYPSQQYPPTEQFGQAYGQPGQYGVPPQYGQPGQYGAPPQYGQPGQPGQYGAPPQYGQPGQYGQYPQYPQPGGEEGSKRGPAVVLGVIVAMAAIVTIAVVVLGFLWPGFFVTTKLDVGAAETGVQQILTDETNGYGATNVQDVTCNDGQNPTVSEGATFDCEVSIDGTKRQVTVTFQDNDGTYEVGRPR